MKKLLLSLILSTIVTLAFAQVKKLQEYIEKGHNFDEICKKADKMIRKNKLEDESYREGEYRDKNGKKEYLDDDKLKFERWKWYWRDRLTEDGKFPDLQRQWSLYNDVIRDSKNNYRSVPEWKHEGPVKNNGGYWGMGRATHVDFHPTLDNVFYVASPNGGLWKTTDNGLTYVSIADNLPYQPVGIVIVDPQQPNVIYITLGEKDGWYQYSMGVYKTTDGGITWNPTSLNWKLTDNKVIYGLEMNPLNTSILIAATNDGIYKTWNGGTTWTKIRTENFSDVKYKPGDTLVVYAASNDYYGMSNIFKSTDGGNTFTQASDFGLQKVFLRIAVTKANPNYVGVNMSVDGARRFYLSQDNGKFFLRLTDPPENSVLYFSQNDQNILYCGYVVIYKSVDKGKTWTQITNWWNSGQYPEIHADHHFITHDPKNKDELYFCCDGGVYRLHESTGKWDELVNGLAITQFYKLAISTTYPPVITGGSQDNGGWVKHSNGTWGNTNGGDAMSQVIDPSNPDIGYTEYWGGNAVYRTTNGFYQLDDITTNIGAQLPGQWVTPFGLDPNNPARFIIGYNDIFVSNNRGNTFTKISENLTGSVDNDLRDVKISPVDANTIVATRANYMYVTKDNGKTWKASVLPSTLEITGFEFHPKDTNRIWCTRGGYGTLKVMTSRDRGVNWINITKNFVNTPVSCIIYDEPYNTLYVGTDFGVFYSNADTINWQYYGLGLPHTAVTDLKIHKGQRKLFASTYGRGFYSINLPDCEPYQITMLAQIDDKAFEDKDYIKICGGNTLTLQAKDSLRGSYHWFGTALNTTILNDPKLNSKIDLNLVPGTSHYVLEFTSDSGCTRRDEINIEFGKEIKFTIEPDHLYLDCNYDSLFLLPSIFPPDFKNNTYRWFGPNSYLVNDYSTTIKDTGNYYLEITDLKSNCSFYDTFALFRVNNPSLDAKLIQTNSCFGDSAASIEVKAIEGKPPYKYYLSNLQTGDKINNLKAGTYILQVLDADLCVGNDTISITDPDDFIVAWTIIPSSGNDGSINLIVSGATPPYSFLWTQNGGSVVVGNTKDVNNLSPGFYDLKITDANGCMYFKNGIEVSDLVSDYEFDKAGFSIFPNPANDYLNLKFKEHIVPTWKIELLDVNGRILKLKDVKTRDQRTLQIRINDLPQGEYFVKLSKGNITSRIQFSKL